MADNEYVRVHCPRCGQWVKCKRSGEVSGISTFYDGKCGLCDKPVLVEDRAAFEQEGAVEIIFK